MLKHRRNSLTIGVLWLGSLIAVIAVVPARGQSSQNETAATARAETVASQGRRDAAQPDSSPTPDAVEPETSATPSPKVPAVPRPARPGGAKSAASNLTIQGSLELVAGPKQEVDAVEVADGLIYFLPKNANAKPVPRHFTIGTQSKGFSPPLLVVPAGSTVSFPNRDALLHNVFSRTTGAAFDLGTYGSGQSRQQVFAKPGLTIVNCSVHHNMRALVVVMATPYYTRPDRGGRFELSGLPSGPGTLVYWHPRAAAVSVEVAAPPSTPQKQRLVATKPRNDQMGAK